MTIRLLLLQALSCLPVLISMPSATAQPAGQVHVAYAHPEKFTDTGRRRRGGGP